jgi:GH15 family glucan-1,4-alpha-glucosidase
MPLVGFLEATDPRMVSIVAAIRRELTIHGLVRRYRSAHGDVDGLPAGEGVFLACSFWLAEVLARAFADPTPVPNRRRARSGRTAVGQ